MTMKQWDKEIAAIDLQIERLEATNYPFIEKWTRPKVNELKERRARIVEKTLN
jgi:hypothetical protein